MIEIVCLQNNPNQANDFWHSQYGERGKNTQASGEIYFELAVFFSLDTHFYIAGMCLTKRNDNSFIFDLLIFAVMSRC